MPNTNHTILPMLYKRRSIVIVVLFICCFSLPFACRRSPDATPNQFHTERFSPENQKVIGQIFYRYIQEHPEMFKLLSAEEYSDVYSYLWILFKTLLNTASVQYRREYDWSLDILHNDTLETAFFLPGGHLFVSTGMLKFLDTESQFLGVVAHELYYTNTEWLLRGMNTEFGEEVLADLANGKEVAEKGKLVQSMPFLSFQGMPVLSADSFSIKILCPFQYQSLGIRDVLKKMLRNEKPFLWAEVRKSPVHLRMEHIERQSLNCDLPGLVNESNYQKMKNRLP